MANNHIMLYLASVILLLGIISSSFNMQMYPQGRMSHDYREMCVGDHLAVKGTKFEWAWQHPRAASTKLLLLSSLSLDLHARSSLHTQR
ncbi:hypothetical protein Bca52824_022213 [Brassica carinata]|uniref:Uncharacterized protein n=1 Tax=Brassica carinata TaxID=52824 RepID=A0A8X7VG85_BRACI|nr:hypothetical protein Bca52824_022213 [Brassica carinata]